MAAGSSLLTDYIGAGLSSAKPTTPGGSSGLYSGAVAFYYATDTGVMWCWNGTSWVVMAAQGGIAQTLTYASSVALNPSLGSAANITLTGAITFANPAVMLPGFSGFIEIIQDATGGRVASFGSQWKFGAAGPPLLSTAPNAVDLLCYTIVDSSRVAASLISAIT